jgi:hypothetical protein
MNRPRPAEDATERDTLVGMLDFLRATVVHKASSVSGKPGRGDRRVSAVAAGPWTDV